MRYLIYALAIGLVAAGCGNSEPAVSSSSDGPTTTVDVTTSTVTQSSDAPPPTSEPATTTSGEPIGSLDDLELDRYEAASGFEQAIQLLTAPGDERWFVVDQVGVVWVGVESEREVFLDISDDVRFSGEQGLLGMAFHPDFVSNRLFYLHYIDLAGNTVVESFTAGNDGADLGSRTAIFTVDQPAGNHNGGMLLFGPDGNLWISLGDGGGADDQFGQGQRSDTVLAALLRISVGPEIDGYDIPDGNIQDEVWAIGLRNPWRFAFDGDDLWIGDVGQGSIEEVDVVDWSTGNPNFGWSIMEGSSCFQADECDQSGLVLPIYEYQHSEGCSITGGVVYSGSAIPELTGQFLFADFCTGWIRSVGRDGQMREWFPEGSFQGAVGFGVDAAGEPYVLTTGGEIYGFTVAG